MGDNTGIEWTDATWNPVTGCTEVSPGCDHCYAKTLAERFRGTPGHYYERGFDVQLRPQRLEEPLRWRRPRKVFVNSMSDLFHAEVPDGYIAQVFAVMAMAPTHTFQLLTKRHGRMRSLLSSETFARAVEYWLATWAIAGDDRFRPAAAGARSVLGEGAWPLPNVWVGVSVEDQQWADIRIPALLATPAAVRFLSCEPLLGPLNLAPYLEGVVMGPGTPHAQIDWAIVGGESGKGARPMHPEWARSLRDQCEAAGVPFLFKQWGEWVPAEQGLHIPATSTPTGATPRGGHRVVYLDQTGQVRDTNELRGFHAPPEWARLARAGKHAAGRTLDGRTWDGYPAAKEAVR